MTQFNVSHDRKPPELREVWWFSQTAGAVIAVVVTIICARLLYPEVGTKNDGVWAWAFMSAMILSEGVCLVYLVVGCFILQGMSNRRVDYGGQVTATVGTVIVTPLITAAVLVLQWLGL